MSDAQRLPDSFEELEADEPDILQSLRRLKGEALLADDYMTCL